MEPIQLSVENAKYILRVLNNAKNLIDEAQILFDYKRYRRSMLLSLLGYEEYMKISMLSKGDSGIFSHKKKFQPINDTIVEFIRENMKIMVANNINDNGWIKFDVKVTNADGGLLPEIEAHLREGLIRKMIDVAPEKLGSFFDFKALREHLMYADPDSNGFTELFLEPSNAEKLAKFFLKITQEKINYIVQKLPSGKCKLKVY